MFVKASTKENQFIINKLIQNNPNSFRGNKYLRKGIENPIYAMLKDEAKNKDLELKILANSLVINLDNDEVIATFSPYTPNLSSPTRKLLNNKKVTKHILSINGIPVPRGEVFANYELANKYFLEHKKPQGIKPLIGSGGKGVSANIDINGNIEVFEQAWNKAKEISEELVEEKPLLVSRKNNPKIKVVVLQTIASGAYKFKAKTASFSIGEGHNNLTNLFDPLIGKNILRVDDIEKAKQSLAAMHDVDFIYNSITDPERCFDALNNAEQICNSFPDIPVINHPQQVKLSSCEDNFSRFANAKHLIFPKVIKINQVDGDCKAKILKKIESNNLSYPIIVRLAGYQAGKNMHKINHADEHDFADFDKILNTVATDIYLIDFKDCSFQDSRLSQEKLYPKFRAFMANGQLFPIHLFVAKNDYNVHRDNSSKLMLEHSWLIELEQCYCEDPLSVIDKDVWESLSHILRKTGLEYVGVDFSVTLGASKQDQVCVIFEINAAMRNSMLSLSDRPHTQTSWRHVTQQMHDYMCVLANKSPWDFNCK